MGAASDGSPEAACPGCGSDAGGSFYEQLGVPAHDCRLSDTRAEAENAPRGDLRLRLCASCGLITNAAFDEAIVEYSSGYEDTQVYSPRFRSFATELARSLIERHRLQGETVLEIGCGQGDFLELMCELGVGRGIGVDPSTVPERLRPELADRISIVPHVFSERDVQVECAAVVCRHTLEHIRPVAEFLETLRRALGTRTGTVVMFEVPDVTRAVHEGAFWDFYYEHCSYFAPGSLARLFRRTGFEVTRLERVYRDQYVVIEARPAGFPAPPSDGLELEEGPADLANSVAGFEQRARTQQERCRRLIESAHGGIALWGSSSKTVSLLTTLELRDEIDAVVDVNPYRHGKYLPVSGHEIVSPEQLAELSPRLVIAMNPIYLDEIRAELDRRRIRADLIAI